jgi:hypothetical protein
VLGHEVAKPAQVAWSHEGRVLHLHGNAAEVAFQDQVDFGSRAGTVVAPGALEGIVWVRRWM